MTTVPEATAAAPASEPATKAGPVLIALAIGSAVAVGLGLYGRIHEPTGQAINIAGFSSGIAAKAFLATVAMVFGVIQMITAMGVMGRVRMGSWVGPVHRWSGRIAVAVSVPVAVHCLYALGFQTFDARVLFHSLFGCFFYGAFVAKMLILTRDDTPKWALPLAAGCVLSGLTALWMTAGLWYYLNF